MFARNSFKYIYINEILLYIDLSPCTFQFRSKYVRYSLAQFASQWKHNVVHTHARTFAHNIKLDCIHVQEVCELLCLCTYNIFGFLKMALICCSRILLINLK